MAVDEYHAAMRFPISAEVDLLSGEGFKLKPKAITVSSVIQGQKYGQGRTEQALKLNIKRGDGRVRILHSLGLFTSTYNTQEHTDGDHTSVAV
jgi:hypothetical protein